MDSTRYIGRVGALAVAVGIGTAWSTGTGVAWAGDGPASGVGDNNSGGGARGSTSAPPNKAGSTAADAATRKGPLSALSSRVRTEVDAGLGNATKRAQSELAKSRTRLETNRAEVQRKIDDAASRLRGTAASAGKSRIVPEAVGVVPDLRQPERTETVVMEITRAAQKDSRDLAQHAVDAIPTVVPSTLGGTADGARRSRIVPEAVGVVPNLRQPERTETVVMEITRAAQKDSRDLAQHADDAIPSVVPPPSTLRGTASPVAAVAAAVSAPVSPSLTDSPLNSALALAAGFSTLLGNGPAAPGQSPALWALAAWVRREFERTINPTAGDLQSAKDAESATPAEIQPMALLAADDQYDPNPGLADAPVITGNANATQVGWTTGPNTNTDHWYIRGTDLGITWDSGYKDEQGNPVIYTMFGDTYSEPDFGGDWRNNVLLRSSDMNLSNGLQFDEALIHAGGSIDNAQWYPDSGARAGAAQIIYDPGYNGLFGSTHTMIPTSAIAVENEDGTYTQYATVMSVRTWDNPGSWTTNYSAIAVSTDGGETWQVDPATVRSSGWLRSSTRYVPGDEHFQQNALVYGDPDDPDSWTSADPQTREKYVYVYGTPSGRQGSAYVARVPESEITNLDAYQYWAGENSDGTGNWVTADPSEAVPVIGASQSDFLPRLYQLLDCFTFGLFTTVANGIWVGGLPTGGNVSEMSVQYNEHLERYVVTYTDGANNVVLRVSDTPQGTWSNPTTLVSVVGNSGAYAPMIHPLSGTDQLGGPQNAKYLYFNLSQWDEYNVRMMQADLDELTIT